MLDEMDVPHTLLSDPSEVLDTPADGEYRMYAGGTTQYEVKDAPNAVDTLLLQPTQLTKTRKVVKELWNQPATPVVYPLGLAGTDAFLMTVSALTGKPIPDSLTKERGRLVDMMTDSHPWLHGKTFALWGDSDFVLGMVRFLLELGAEPTHILCANANKKWEKEVRKVLDASPFGARGEIHIGKDLWHMRSLVFAERPDFMIGNSYGKFIQRDTRALDPAFEVPLIRIGFPIFDRHHLHRATTLGYEGAMQMLATLVNAVLEKLDQETGLLGQTDFNYDLVR
jgi:nitrogenase molybdenum-iron protein beta chain